MVQPTLSGWKFGCKAARTALSSMSWPKVLEHLNRNGYNYVPKMR